MTYPLPVPENARGFLAFLDRLKSLGEHPPRYLSASLLVQPKQRGPNGRRLCRWCWEEVPHGRLAWCSDTCVEELTKRTGTGLLSRVLRRDKGVCARCGADANMVERICYRLLEHGRLRDGAEEFISREAAALIRRAWGRRTASVWSYSPTALWEADHIIPVWQGGGCSGPDNFRTLCVPCHREVTAEQAGARAAARRPQQSLPLDEATA